MRWARKARDFIALPRVSRRPKRTRSNSHNKLGVVGGPAGGTGVALLSLRDANSLPLLVDTTLPNFIGSFVVSLGLDGVGTLDLGPPAPWMAGATFFAQWVCINPVTGLTSFSNGAKFAVQ